MNKLKYLIFILTVLIMNSNTVLAACTQEEINTFKRIEDDYTVKYEFNKSTKTYDLYFSASKPKEFYYKIYYEGELDCQKHDEKTMKCNSFQSGEYPIEIVGMSNTCDDVMKFVVITLPKYNKLSEDPLCEGIEEFILCNPTYSKEIDYETFVSRVNTYKKNHIKEEENNETEEGKTNETTNKIIDYIVNNWINIVIISIFVILLIITIVVTYKNSRKSRYLE